MRRTGSFARSFFSVTQYAYATASQISLPKIPIVKKDDSKNSSLRALCLVKNPHKKAEFKSIFDTYGVRMSTETSEAEPDIEAILKRSNPTPHFILKEITTLQHAITSEIIPAHLTNQHHMAPVINRSTLHVWKPVWHPSGELKEISYKKFMHDINGYLDKTRLSETDEGFGWDPLFVCSATEQTHAQSISRHGKVSARQLVLDAFIAEYLFYRTPKDLKSFPFSPKKAIDFDISVAHFIRTNTYLSNPFLEKWGINHVLCNLLNQGLFFRAAWNRPGGNYFSPPFGGVPLTQKKSGVEETVYMMHDINHHNVPDLIYDGKDSYDHKQVYAAWRMMSEAMTMVMADMLYADTLCKMGVDTKHLDTRIFPLFQALDLPEITLANRTEIIVRLLHANVTYAVMGDDSLWRALLKPGQEDKLDAFKKHFAKFFIGDHEWTHANYENMAKMKTHYSAWVSLVGHDQFKRSDTVLLSDMITRIAKRGCNTMDFDDVVKHVFDEIIETRIVTALNAPSARLTEDQQTSNAFYRYMIGQTSFYAKYKNVTGMPERAQAMISVLKNTPFFDKTTREEISEQFSRDVYYCWGKQIITTSMAVNICQLHPVFPPVYIAYGRSEYTEIAAIKAALYDQPKLIESPAPTEDAPLTVKMPTNKYVRVINGTPFIDMLALEHAIDKSIPAKHRLRQKMIYAGVEFWDEAKLIVKKPVVGIYAMGSFSVSFTEDTPADMICLSFGDTRIGPLKPSDIAEGMKKTMGSQSFHSYMNPSEKSALDLYNTSVDLKHLSITHSATIGLEILGLSKIADHEFAVQRDLVHLARFTTARTNAQDEPTLVAQTAEGAKVSLIVRQNTAQALASFEKNAPAGDWREERNAMWPSNRAMSLGINGTIRNLEKLLKDLDQTGKELEYRNILISMSEALHGLFPELFSSAKGIALREKYRRPPHTPSTDKPEKPAIINQPPSKKQSTPFPWKYGIVPMIAGATLLATGLWHHPKKPKEGVLLLGAPGVGKSTQTELLSKRLPHIMCISTGNLVRKLNQKVQSGAPLNGVEKKAAESLDRMRQGGLMDDKAVYALLFAYISPGGAGYAEYTRAETIIFDGVIKADENIKPFEEALMEFNATGIGVALNKVINISAPTDELIARQKHRVDEATAKGIVQRPDDNPALYAKRLNEYMNKTAAVIDHYQYEKDFVDIDSMQGIENTTMLLVDAITARAMETYEKNMYIQAAL